MSNSIAIARDLFTAGLTQEQANAIAEAVVTHANDNHASKADLAELDSDFRTALAEFRAEVKTEFAEVRAEVKASVHFLYWAVGACLFVNLATFAIVVNLLLKLTSAG